MSAFGGKPSIAARFFGDLFQMATWQKVALGTAALVGGTGIAGETYSSFHPTPPEAIETRQDTTGTAAPGRGPNFIDPATAPPAQREATPPASTPTAGGSFFEQYSPAMMGTGLSFVLAYIVGWAFRVFVKTMIIVFVLGAALLLGLSYFNVVNLDLSKAQEKYSTSIAWITDQAVKLKDAAIAHFPASSSGVMGLLVGLRRK